MREFKFRAWFHKSSPTSNGDFMLYSPLVAGSDRPRVHPTSITEPSWKGFWNNVFGFWGKVTVMQWTGLQDRNGVDIYEGDVVQTAIGNIRVIVWRDGASHSQVHNWQPGTDMPTHPIHFWGMNKDLLPTVIGNVHQNPELVETRS